MSEEAVGRIMLHTLSQSRERSDSSLGVKEVINEIRYHCVYGYCLKEIRMVTHLVALVDPVDVLWVGR